MKMISDQAVTKKAEGIAFFGLPQSKQEGQEVPGVMKNGGSIIAAIKCMIDQPIHDWSRQARHAATLHAANGASNEKMN